MRTRSNLALFSLVLGALLCGCASKPETVGEKATAQQEARAMSGEVLASLYQAQPAAKAAVESSAGYAVFRNFGMKILVAGGGSGKGLAIDNKTKKETFMRMAEIQAGLGMGVKKFSLVWVFDTTEAYNSFVNQGWQFGAQATAAAKANDQGRALQGAVPVAPGIWLYQITDTGLALELTAKGTKYYKDEALNQ